MIINAALSAVAIVLIVCGLLLLPLPIPLGAIFILIGTGLAITVSPKISRLVQRHRSNNPRLEGVITRVVPYLPRFMRKPIEASAPKSRQS